MSLKITDHNTVIVFDSGLNLCLPAYNYDLAPYLDMARWSTLKMLVTSLLQLHMIPHSVFDDRIEVDTDHFKSGHWFYYEASSRGSPLWYNDEWQNGAWLGYRPD